MMLFACVFTKAMKICTCLFLFNMPIKCFAFSFTFCFKVFSRSYESCFIGAVVRALDSHQCGQSLIPRLGRHHKWVEVVWFPRRY